MVAIRLRIIALFATLNLAAGLAAAPPPGRADVTLTVDGQAIRLVHAYARVELNMDSVAELAVLLTDRPLSVELLDRGIPLHELLANAGQAHGLHFSLTGEGRPEGWNVVHPLLSTGCVQCSDWDAEATRTAAAVRGRVFTRKPQQTNGRSWSFSGEFNAVVEPGWEAAAEAAATPAQRALRKQLRAEGLHFTPDWFFTGALMNAGNVIRYLDAGMPPDTPNPSTGDTLLLEMLGGDLSDGQRAAVKELLRRGADANRVSQQGGGTALARVYCCADIAGALLDAGARLDAPSGQKGRTAGQALMDAAIALSKTDVVRLLVARGYPVAAERDRLLKDAVGRPEVEKILREATGARGSRPPADARPSRPPAEAAPARAPVRPMPSRAEAAATLEARGLPPSQDALWRALMDDDAEMVRLLLAAGVSPNEPRAHDGATPLLFVTFRQYGGKSAVQTAMVLDLIAAGADVNRADSNNAPPILHAAQYCETAAVRALLKAGARTNVKAKGGATPMMMAVIFNRADNVAALLEGGYDVKPELDMLRSVAASYPETLRMIEAAAKK